MPNRPTCIDELEQENARLRARIAELEAAANLPSPPATGGTPYSLIADVFNAAQDAIFVKDLEGRYLIINEIGARMLGREVQDCVGKDDSELFPPESARKIREVDMRVIEDGEASMIEEEVETASGMTTFLSIKGPFRDADNTVIGMFGISRDITQRKAAEEALRLSEERLKLAQVAGGFGTWDWDVLEKRGTCSPAYNRLFGYPDDADMPSFDEWLTRIHPADRDRAADAMFEAHVNERACHVEYRILAPGQATRWVEARASIFRDPHGEIRRVVGVLFDITHQKEEEARLENIVGERTKELHNVLVALRRSEKRYRLLFDSIDDALLVHDLQGRILDCNDVQCNRLGYSRQELLNMTTRDIDSPEFAKGFADRLAIQQAERHYQSEGLHRTRDGRDIPVDISSTAMSYLGTDAVLSMSRDISQRKQAEAEHRALEEQMRHAQKLESLGLLAGGIAHDFNNLLAGIMGHTELAADQLVEHHPVRSELDGIISAAERAAGLCGQMLAYSGRGQFVIQVLDLNHAVREISKLVEASLNKKILLQFKLADELPAIEADSAQITQLVLNLMTNAAEAIGDGKGTIKITTCATTRDTLSATHMLLDTDLEDGNYVRLSVEDNGSGMDEETVARIFDPFFTTKITGRGLGLAAVIGIVRGHSGTMQVVSTPGQGTRFDVYLPASRRHAPDTPSSKQTTLELKTGETLLVVDDEPFVLNVAERMLERKGYNIITADNGHRAIELFKQHQAEIDAVILDLTMPELNGRETYLELRSIDPKVRVLLSSGYSDREVVELLDNRGNLAFIQKPYQSRIFYEKVREIINQ